jgi:hypothetical protein
LEEAPLQIELVGSTFVNWGSSSAPEGSTFIYSGYAYASYYAYTGGTNKPIVVKKGDPGEYFGSYSNASDLFYLQTGSINIPPGITANSYIKAAVNYADSPTIVIWGTHMPPDGWEVLYTGYTMGAYTHDESQIGPICVNSNNFESEATNWTDYAPVPIIGARVSHAAPGDNELRGSFIKCNVCKKTE